jgi:hypothetical protein
MSVENCDLKTCSRCRCTLLLKYFDTNRKGQLFKTCNNCRIKHRDECKNVRTANSEGYAIIDCPCGETITGTSNYKVHVQSDKHRKYLHAQNTARQLEAQQQLPDELKHMIKIDEFQSKQSDVPTIDGKFVCACKCKLGPDKYKIKRHTETTKHIKRMNWVNQGLDPDVETAREEREEEQRRREYYDNGGHELDWLKQLDWEANLPSNKEWVEEFLKKREHLPEWARHKDKIQAIRDKLLNPPKPPMSEEERARIRARQLAPRTIR